MKTINDLVATGKFKLTNAGENMETTIEKVFCCDLLSVAMGKAPAGSAWVTVMANVNTFAVATLAEVACVILAEGMEMDDVTLEKAVERGIPVFSTEEPVFESALFVKDFIEG